MQKNAKRFRRMAQAGSIVAIIGLVVCSHALAGNDVKIEAGEDLTIDAAWVALNGEPDNVQVEEGGSVRIIGVRVNGNVQADGALLVDIMPRRRRPTRVLGDVQIKKSTLRVRVIDSLIEGNLQVEENEVIRINLNRNLVGGDLQVDKNDADVLIRVRANAVGGNLQGEENFPAPINAGNVVEGDSDGQFS